jgi:site-specific DNA-methyltransferase (adenine-specific)
MHKANIYLQDCMEGMKQYPDKYFDLAVVDPPYGIDVNPNMGLGKGQRKRHKKISWDDCTPPPEYFDELFRVSANQIIWGGNYFSLPPTRHFIFWDKMNPEGLSFSDGEMAWTSYSKAIRKYGRRNQYDGKIHPTEKPIGLYDWIYANYLPNGGKVIDTHGGSMSNVISALRTGNIEIDCYEIDPDYFKAAQQRIKTFFAQQNMYVQTPEIIFHEELFINQT